MKLKLQPKLIDTHIHLSADVYERKIPKLLSRSVNAGVSELWLMGVDFHSSQKNIEIAAKYQKKFPELKLKVGVGFDMELLIPGSDLFQVNWFKMTEEQLLQQLELMYEELFRQANSTGIKVEIIGEIGLDNYWLEKNYQLSINEPEEASAQGVLLRKADVDRSQDLQRAMFRRQLEIASRKSLPVSIHSRGAESDCIKMITQFKSGQELEGVFHSFTGNISQQLEILRLGMKIGVNGIITYKSALRNLQAVRRSMKLSDSESLSDFHISPRRLKDRLEHLYQSGFVLETDGPYLVPANYNHEELRREYGEVVNEPAAINSVLDKLFRH